MATLTFGTKNIFRRRHFREEALPPKMKRRYFSFPKTNYEKPLSTKKCLI